MDAIGRYPAISSRLATSAVGSAPRSTLSPAPELLLRDRVTISAEERERAKAEAAKQKLEQLERERQALQEELERSNEQSDAMKDSMETQGKCFTIAMRIMAGDIVPVADQRYLSKNNPELYAQAITLRVERSDPRRYKRLSEEEKAPEAAAEVAGAAGDSETVAEGGETAPPTEETPTLDTQA